MESVKLSIDGEYRTDGEVGYTGFWSHYTHEKNQIFNSLEEEREKLGLGVVEGLQFISSHASLEIAEYLNGREVKFDNLAFIRKLIQNNIIPGKEEEKVMFYYDENTTAPLITAMSKDSEKENFRAWYNHRTGRDYNRNAKLSSQDVRLEMRLLYMELRDFELLSEERQRTLMDFCVSFSQYIPSENFKRYIA